MNSAQYNDFYDSLDIANGYATPKLRQHDWHIWTWKAYRSLNNEA